MTNNSFSCAFEWFARMRSTAWICRMILTFVEITLVQCRWCKWMGIEQESLCRYVTESKSAQWNRQKLFYRLAFFFVERELSSAIANWKTNAHIHKSKPKQCHRIAFHRWIYTEILLSMCAHTVLVRFHFFSDIFSFLSFSCCSVPHVRISFNPYFKTRHRMKQWKRHTRKKNYVLRCASMSGWLFVLKRSFMCHGVSWTPQYNTTTRSETTTTRKRKKKQVQRIKFLSLSLALACFLSISLPLCREKENKTRKFCMAKRKSTMEIKTTALI